LEDIEGTVEVVAHLSIGMVMIVCTEGVALEGITMGRTATMRNEEESLGVEALDIRGTAVGAQLGGGIEVLSGKVARKGGPKSSSGTEIESRLHLLITTMVVIVIAMGIATTLSSTVISFGRIRLETLSDVMAFWYGGFTSELK